MVAVGSLTNHRRYTMARYLLQLKVPKIDTATGTAYTFVCGVDDDDMADFFSFRTPFGVVVIQDENIDYVDRMDDGLEGLLPGRDLIWVLN
jgi:hypothetical protein